VRSDPSLYAMINAIRHMHGLPDLPHARTGEPKRIRKPRNTNHASK
jgi:hypothetical protein